MGAFADAAAHLARYGLATIPCIGKKPAVAWARIGCPPTASQLRKWSAQYPKANVGVLTGVSGLTVVDADSPDAISMVEPRCGTARLIINSPRGRHFYYRSAGERSATKLDGLLGLDVRGKGGMIIAPPSVGADGTPYEFFRGSWDDISRLTPARPGSLPLADDIGEGSRNSTLWRLCMKAARQCETEDELLIHAEILNESHCLPPLDHREVRQIVASAWSYEERGANFIGSGGGGLVFARDIELLDGQSDPVYLIAFLRKTHAGTRASTFALAAEAMAAAGTVPGWGRKRIMAAVRILENRGLIHMVCKGTGRGHPYRFSFRCPAQAAEKVAEEATFTSPKVAQRGDNKTNSLRSSVSTPLEPGGAGARPGNEAARDGTTCGLDDDPPGGLIAIGDVLKNVLRRTRPPNDGMT